MIEYELSEDEKIALESLKEFSKKIDNVPEDEKIPISNPDKYSFPIGMDDEGNLNVVKSDKNNNLK